MKRILLRSLLALSVALPALSLLSAPPPATVRLDEATDLVEQISSKRDEADPALIVQLANLRSKAAVDGLLVVYDRMASIYMKREVVRALVLLDGVTEAEQTALQKLMDVATTSEEPELREAALEGLGQCQKLGKAFLQMIVESGAEDEVREQAMRLHVARAEEADLAWYRGLFEKEKKGDDEPKKDKKDKKKDEDEEAAKQLLVHKLATVRELAFEALAPSLAVDELEEACSDRWWAIRGLALDQLAKKDPRRAEKRAQEIFEKLDERAEARAIAARILTEAQGAKFSKDLIEVADKHNSVTPLALKFAIADLLAGLGDPKIEATLVKRVGKGKGADEKLWVLRAVRNSPDEDLGKAIAKLLKDKDPDVQMAACRLLGERKETDALEDLMKLVEEGEQELLVAAVLDAISAIRAGEAEWVAQLVQLAGNPDIDIRNAALLQLGALQDEAHLGVLEAALASEQWSTRYAALRGLERLRTKSVVPLMIGRMDKESGRMLHEFADALFELTGQPFRTAAGNWKAWWEREGASFEVISSPELEKRREEEEERRLRQITNVKFFGIRIISHRVIFIIDVSGSMAETMRATYAGENATDTRLSVAQRELKKCIDSLDPKALFNMITFSDGAEGWLDGITGSTGKSRDEAKAFVDRLGAFGATNLYDSLRLAFDDPEVDTIFVLSDGEPTAGAQTDAGMIREHVRQWNEHRGITINCISVGLQLRVLQMLAEDTGGKYVQFF